MSLLCVCLVLEQEGSYPVLTVQVVPVVLLLFMRKMLSKRDCVPCFVYKLLAFCHVTLQVRGVGAGGIVSSAFCLLYKLFTLKLTKKQVIGLITHKDSPYIRGLGFMYIRYVSTVLSIQEVC